MVKDMQDVLMQSSDGGDDGLLQQQLPPHRPSHGGVHLDAVVEGDEDDDDVGGQAEVSASPCTWMQFPT